MKPLVLVGVSGSIAAYKAVQLVRELIGMGCDVQVLPTAASLHFVGAATWEAVTGRTVSAEVFDGAGGVEHVELARRAALAVVAPASANILAKLAVGLADDMATTTLLAATCPVVVAPAMHTAMWHHPATQANMATLTRRGVTVVGPASGELTSGDVGTGRMSEPSEIARVAAGLLGTPSRPAPGADLAGLCVVISAGGTREPLDPVRFLTNRSSGRQGVELAREALARGADVTLVAGAMEVPAPPGVTLRQVQTAAQMQDEVRRACAQADVVVMAAAVSDFRPATPSATKVKKSGPTEPVVLTLIPNPDILAGLVQERPNPGLLVVGFAAETGDAQSSFLQLGQEKARRKGADLMVINQVGDGVGMETTDNTVVMVDGRGEVLASAQGPKREVARAIWDQIVVLRAQTVR